MPGAKGDNSEKAPLPRVSEIRRRTQERDNQMLRSKEGSRRERSSNFQAFVRMALETLLGSCRRKRGIHTQPADHVHPSKTFMSWHRPSLPARPFLLVRAVQGV